MAGADCLQGAGNYEQVMDGSGHIRSHTHRHPSGKLVVALI